MGGGKLVVVHVLPSEDEMVHSNTSFDQLSREIRILFTDWFQWSFEFFFLSGSEFPWDCCRIPHGEEDNPP